MPDCKTLGEIYKIEVPASQFGSAQAVNQLEGNTKGDIRDAANSLVRKNRTVDSGVRPVVGD